jgi:N-acyl-D-aspartate/D-glutamate deacylase
VASTASAQTPAFDIVITGGMVIDGTGSPAYRADVAIAGGRIMSVAHADRRVAGSASDQRRRG